MNGKLGPLLGIYLVDEFAEVFKDTGIFIQVLADQYEQSIFIWRPQFKLIFVKACLYITVNMLISLYVLAGRNTDQYSYIYIHMYLDRHFFMGIYRVYSKEENAVR